MIVTGYFGYFRVILGNFNAYIFHVETAEFKATQCVGSTPVLPVNNTPFIKFI
jgi:hypothetical protein